MTVFKINAIPVLSSWSSCNIAAHGLVRGIGIVNLVHSAGSEQEFYPLEQVIWTAEQLENRQLVKLKEVPFNLRLFKVAVKNGDVDWVITNSPDEMLITPVAQDVSDYLRSQLCHPQIQAFIPA